MCVRAYAHTHTYIHTHTHTCKHTQIKHGEKFLSETDTEVIPKLFRFIYQGLNKGDGDVVPFSKVGVHAGEKGARRRARVFASVFCNCFLRQCVAFQLYSLHSACKQARMHTYTHVRTHTHAHTHAHMHTYTHKHTHTLNSLQLVMEVLKKMEGAYALVVKSRHYPGEMVACKRGSPLILGIKVCVFASVCVYVHVFACVCVCACA